jgi:phage shock protein C
MADLYVLLSEQPLSVLSSSRRERNLSRADFVVPDEYGLAAGGEPMRRLYRSRKNKVIAGVCGGIAEYFDVDPVLIRIIAILFLFTGCASLIAYIVGMIIIPKAPEPQHTTGQPAPAASTVPERPENARGIGTLIVGIILILFGINLLFRNIPFFGQYYWWFWGIGWPFFWPSMLIVFGVLAIILGTRKR